MTFLPMLIQRMQWTSGCKRFSGRLVKFTQVHCKFWCLSKLHYLDVWRSATFPEKLQAYNGPRPYKAFPGISIASNKRWDEKAWVQGYPANITVPSL